MSPENTELLIMKIAGGEGSKADILEFERLKASEPDLDTQLARATENVAIVREALVLTDAAEADSPSIPGERLASLLTKAKKPRGAQGFSRWWKTLSSAPKFASDALLKMIREENPPKSRSREENNLSDLGESRDYEFERFQFPATQWTMVLQAQDATVISSQRALSELCEMYWYPLYAFVRRLGCDVHDAEDVTQGFFAQLVKKDSLAKVAQNKGRLRSFLVKAIKNYLNQSRERAQAQKRGGGIKHLPIDADGAEARYNLEPGHELTPEVLYDRQWAMTVMKHARDRLEQLYVKRGKGDLFDALSGFCFGNSDLPLSEVARQFDMSEASVRMAATRMRKRYKDSTLR